MSTLTGFNKAVIRLLRVDVPKSRQKNFYRLETTTTDVKRIQLEEVNAKWMREFFAYDPAIGMAKMQSPVLAITGSQDIQVAPSDLQRMAGLIPQNFESHFVPGSPPMRDDQSNAGLK